MRFELSKKFDTQLKKASKEHQRWIFEALKLFEDSDYQAATKPPLYMSRVRKTRDWRMRANKLRVVMRKEPDGTYLLLGFSLRSERTYK